MNDASISPSTLKPVKLNFNSSEQTAPAKSMKSSAKNLFKTATTRLGQARAEIISAANKITPSSLFKSGIGVMNTPEVSSYSLVETTPSPITSAASETSLNNDLADIEGTYKAQQRAEIERQIILRGPTGAEARTKLFRQLTKERGEAKAVAYFKSRKIPIPRKGG